MCTTFDMKNGENFVFSVNEEAIPEWNKKNHSLFTPYFKEVCVTLLCIQKYYYRHIDKNIYIIIRES